MIAHVGFERYGMLNGVMGRKQILIIGTFFALVIGAVIYLTLSSGDETAMQSMREQNKAQTEQAPASSQAGPTTQAMDTPPAPTGKPGTYVDYYEGIIANTAGTKLLFFHASWCPQCRTLESDIKASQIPGDVTIIKVDYDGHQALRQKYGVTIQTTLVRVDDSGNAIKKFVAYQDPSLDAAIKNLL